ncbi:MAG: cation:proton antiporter [Candidatus Thorarchaeota archaeon]|nr:cation:proton antiporter [Candidatus Thorarchaeota archaeon]
MALDLYLIAPILIGGALIAKLSERYRFPYPIPLIIAGVLIGQVVPLNDLSTEIIGLDLIAQLTLATVLFYAGLTMNIRELRFSLTSVMLLATLGVLVTSIVAGFTIAMFTSLGVVAFLIGAVLSPTDPAALFSVLESGGVRVKRKVFSILEGEAVFNDATAVVLVITVFTPIIIPALSVPWFVVVQEFFLSMIVGILIGFGIAYVIGSIIVRTGEDTSLSILTAATPILAYGIGELFAPLGIHPGALAAVFAGIFMANARRMMKMDPLPQKSMRGAMKNVSFAFEIVIFILLGATVDIQHLFLNPDLVMTGLITAALVILLARPIAVFLVTAYDKGMGWRDRFLVSWAGVKGVATAALAAISIASITRYAVPGFAEIARTINGIVFIVLMVSLTVQGITTPFLASALGLTEKQDVTLEITARRDATRQALLHLVDLYTEGKIDNALYTRLKAELEEEIFTLEDDLRKIISETRARLRELEVRESLLTAKLDYYRKQYEAGKIDDSSYETYRRELEAEIEEIQMRMRSLSRGMTT